MKVGILGSGDVGRALAAGFLKHGHEAMLGTRDPDKSDIRAWAHDTPRAALGTFAQAASFGEIVVLAVLGRVAGDVIDLAGVDNLAGKTLIDATNPIADAPPVNGILQFTTGPNESLGERVQAKIPRTRVVKAFNSVGNALMVNPHFTEGTPTMFLCGDSEEAKAQVARIIEQFGWQPYDCGSIVSARALEPLCMLWCLPGFLKNDWHRHAFKMLVT
ncbi:DNA-binding protein [Trinickia terrae]|uniref:DNA-binding protein n=1 Tax=Trinickia terrae TaxID=2571161 RepID=A0A4U1I643_9BURK|nr:NAD(P)-binding domain-containing protein [Trinickia terrae]TKC88812.1 DNA-binding protein [Trinickia terrae]